MQTKPVQIYRITARDAMPPARLFFHDGDNDDDDDDKGDKDASLDGGVKAAAAMADVGADPMASDGMAVSKGGGGGVGGGGGGSQGRGGSFEGDRSAAKFEKVID